ncbi:MAG: flagellar filament capping protein FliD [Lachnospiraceae bacterium]|nr:flagellar filament capping protein FliD [Lachnospiraceae bacterium]MBQ9232675.1 flagellar filament capping protein FliD [Lachnospiraceae bacterium]
MTSSSGSSILTDYAAIKNGSYKKLAKKYYASDSVKTESEAKAETKKLGLVQTGADSLSSSLSALSKSSLYEKKKISSKDETTGETSEKEDYDWKAITSAVKSFIDNYNDTIGDAADTNLAGVLRNAMHMTSSVKANSKLLLEVGITIGKENKLELDEDKLKEANISTLKTLFTGSNSFADNLTQKSAAISKAISNSASSYTSSGSALPTSFSKMFETEV